MARPLSRALPEILERFARAPRVFVGLDFDGTLAHIVNDAHLARLPENTRDQLNALVACKDVFVAVISGRSLDDVKARVDVTGVTYCGNHGLEISGHGINFVEETALRLQPLLAELGRELQTGLSGIPGVVVEDKGLSLSIHFRKVAPRNEDVVRQIVDATVAGRRDAIRVTLGHKVFECRPQTSWHKGTAAKMILERIGGVDTLALIIGDDETDEDAFDAMPEAISVKVGTSSDTSANYFVDSPSDVHEFLAALSKVRVPGAGL